MDASMSAKSAINSRQRDILMYEDAYTGIKFSISTI